MAAIRASELKGAAAWLNSKPLTLKELKGKVVLVDFWTYTCVNCLRTLPFIKEWHKRYKDQGLVIIGVHTPEFGFEKEEENVSRFIKKADIEYPVVLDNYREIWNRFANRYWPSKYLIDASGYIRYHHFGEGAYAQTEETIQQLLKEINSSVKLYPISQLAAEAEIGKVCFSVTPETYTGFARGLPGNEQRAFDKVLNFQDTAKHNLNRYYLQGEFIIRPAYVRHARRTEDLEDYLLLIFHSFEVNAVMRSSLGEQFPVYLELDGKPLMEENKGNDVDYNSDGRSFVKLIEPKMYNLLNNLDLNPHTLKMMSNSDQWETYAFTFGACTKKQKAA